MEQYIQYCDLWITYFDNADRKTWFFTSESNFCILLWLYKTKSYNDFIKLKKEGNLATESEKFY